MKQHSHDLKDMDHFAANISSSQVPTQVETEDSHTVKCEKREDSPSVYRHLCGVERGKIRHESSESDEDKRVTSH